MRKLLLSFAALVCAFCVNAQETTVTTNFGSASGSVKVDNTSVTYTDNAGYDWTITTVTSSSSFTQNASYSQIGAAKKPATSITAETTFPANATINITSVSVKFGGFSGTAGNITVSLGSTELATGALNASSDVTVAKDGLNLPAAGETLKIHVNGIDKGVKLYSITYTYTEGAPVVIDKVETPVPSVAPGTYTEEQTIELTVDPGVATIYYSLTGDYENTDGFVKYTEPFVLTGNTVVKTYATYEDLTSETGEYTYTINIDLEAPVASVESGEYDTVQTVELTCATENAKIFYSLSGVTDGFEEYTHPVKVAATATLEAYSQLSTRKSETVTYEYTINIDPTKGGEIEVTFSSLGYPNGHKFLDTDNTIELDQFITLSFDQGSSSNPAAYYNTGTNIRVYNGSSFTVSSALGNIVSIEFLEVTSNSDSISDLAVNTGTYTMSTSTWTGSAKEVTFSNTTTSQFRFTGIKVTYEGVSTPEPTVLYLLTEANGFEAAEGYAFTETDGVYELEVASLTGNFLIGSADKKIIFGASPVSTLADEPISLTGVLGSETYFVGDYEPAKEGDTFTLSFPWDGKADTITMAVTNNGTTSIADIEAADAAEAVYYNLQGVRVAQPTSGIYVRVAAGKAVKVAL